LAELAAQAQVRVAVDLPSGVATDDGALLSPVPDFDLTITFGSLKPAHLLQPAARHMGRLVVADIGVPIVSTVHEIARPKLRPPGNADPHASRRRIRPAPRRPLRKQGRSGAAGGGAAQGGDRLQGC